MTLVNGRPNDVDPDVWYIAALNCAENVETNQLFCETLPTPRDDMLTHLCVAPVTVPCEFNVWYMKQEHYEEWKALQRDMANIAYKEANAGFEEVKPR
jgi:hypothetical protein